MQHQQRYLLIPISNLAKEVCAAGPIALTRGLSIGRGVSSKELKLKAHWIQFSGNHCALSSEVTVSLAINAFKLVKLICRRCIQPDGLQWFITDSSTNGTWIITSEGSTRLDKGVKVRVTHNDKIQLSMPPAETLEFQFVLDPPPQPPTLKRKAPSNENEPAMNHGGSSPGNCIEKEILRDEARAHKKISPPPPAPTHPSVPQYRPEGQHMLTPAPPHAPATSPLPRVPPQQAGIVTPIAIDSSSALISAHYEKQLSDLQSRLEKTRAMADDSQKELIKEREKVVRMEREHEVALRSVEQKAEERSVALVEAANKELEATRVRLDESHARILDLEARLSEEKTRGIQSESTLIQQRGEIDSHKASLAKAHATIEALGEEIKVHGVKVSCMEQERESLESRVREEEGARVRAQEDLCAASRALEAQVEAKGAAQKVLEGLRAQLHDQEAKRDQEHRSRVAAEAKTLTLESELYEARRNIEVLEEKVQGVVGRGDLFKIRAEDLARATSEAYSRFCSLSTLMQQIYASTHEMTSALNPNANNINDNPNMEHNPNIDHQEVQEMEEDEERGAAHVPTAGGGGGEGEGGGGRLFDTPPPSHSTFNNAAVAPATLTAAVCNGLSGGAHEEDVVMDEREEREEEAPPGDDFGPDPHLHGDVGDEEEVGGGAEAGGQGEGGRDLAVGLDVITITTQMEEELGARMAAEGEGVRVKEEQVEVEVEDNGRMGDEVGGGDEMEAQGGALGPQGGLAQGQGQGQGQGGAGHFTLSSPVNVYDLGATTQILSYAGGAFGSSIMVATATAGQDPPPSLMAPLPEPVVAPEAEAEAEAVPPVIDTLMDKEDQVEGERETDGTVDEAQAVAPPLPPQAVAPHSILLEEVAPYCEYDASLVAAGTNSERDLPPAPPPSAADERVFDQAGQEEGGEGDPPALLAPLPAPLPAVSPSKMMMASEAEGMRVASERMVLADIANAAV